MPSSGRQGRAFDANQGGDEMEKTISKLTLLGERPVLKTALLASSMWTGVTGAAFAQDSSRDTIVVTAQKR